MQTNRWQNPRSTHDSDMDPEVTQPTRADYGSEGWGFEFLRACYRNPRKYGGFCFPGFADDGLR